LDCAGITALLPVGLSLIQKEKHVVQHIAKFNANFSLRLNGCSTEEVLHLEYEFSFQSTNSANFALVQTFGIILRFPKSHYWEPLGVVGDRKGLSHMAVKYTCPKCNRRFADWGAKKMDFKCPHDENCPPGTEDEIIELHKVGANPDDSSATKPSLKRKKAVVARVAPEAALLEDGDELVVVEDLDDVDDIDDSDEDEEPEVLKPVVKSKKAALVVADDIDEDAEDIDFEDAEVVEEEFVELDEEV